MVESWINDYEGLYKINTQGCIFNVRLNRYMKDYNSGKGYRKINLTKDKRVKSFYVHRLVAIHFLPQIVGKTDVNHKDGVKANNNIDNLEWASRSENIQHSWDNRLSKKRFKASPKIRQIMFDLYSIGFSYQKIGEIFNMGITPVRNGILEHKKCYGKENVND